MNTEPRDQPMAAGPDLEKKPSRFADWLLTETSALVILVVSLLVTVAAWRISAGYEAQRATDAFEFKVERATRAIERRMRTYEQVLRGGIGLLTSSEQVSRDEWRAYVNNLGINTYWPGIQGIGFARMLRPEEVAAHEAEVRREGFPDYKVWPEGKRDLYSAIVYLEPFDKRNQRAFGYDMYSEPTRRAAMSRARDTGEPAVSGRVTLVQEMDRHVQAGFLMYLPLYRRGLPLATVADRRAALVGFVYSPFRAEDLMAGILVNDAVSLDFHLYDGTVADPANMLVDSRVLDAQAGGEGQGSFHAQRRLTMRGREWLVEFHSLPSFDREMSSGQPMLVALFGVFVDGLLYTMIHALARKRRESAQSAARLEILVGDLNRNMAQREEAEAALRLSETRANQIIENAPEAILLVDSHGLIQRANSRAITLFDYPEEALLGQPVELLIPERYRHAHGQRRAAFVADAERRPMGRGLDLFARRRDGSEIPVDVMLVPIQDDGDQRIVVTVMDTTQRRAAEAKMRRDREQQAVLRELLEIVLQGGPRDATLQRCLEHLLTVSWLTLEPKGGIFIMGPDGRALELVATHNLPARILTMCGNLPLGRCLCGRAAASGKVQFADCVDDRHENAYPGMTDHGHYSLPLVMDGQVLGVLVLYLPAHANREEAKEGFLASVSGVLAAYISRKHAESELAHHQKHLEVEVVSRTAELRQQTLTLRALIDSLPMMVWIKDQNSVYRAVNRRVADAAGRPPAEIVGLNDQDLWVGELAEAYRADDREIMSLGTSKTIEEEFIAKDGQYSWIETYKTAVFDEDGSLLGTVGYALDITERKQVEAAREAARKEAERLARVKSEFLANMSHEIRTPMNAVLGLAQIGLRDSEGQPVNDIFARIQDAGRHLLGVINDILDFSKLEAGKLQVEQRAFRLADVIDDALGFIAPVAEEKGLPVEFVGRECLPEWVSGDPLRLGQVLVNLLSNAVKFTDGGKVTLTIWREEDETVFELRDTGIGMSQEHLARLFTPFEQADGSTTRRFGGTGLGLAITQQLVTLMGGSLRAESQLGIGSTFTLRLPLPAVRPAASRPAGQIGGGVAARGKRLARLRILAAEDVEVNRLVLEDMLNHEGAHVVFTEHGRQALDRLEEAGVDAFDVVLMDVQMPVMDGYEAAQRIHALAPALPIIGLTAHAMAEERKRCLDAGMVEHITKPVDLDRLVAAILRHTGNHQDESAVLISQINEARAEELDRTGSAPAPGHEDPDPIDWRSLTARFNNRQTFIDRLLVTVKDGHAHTPAALRAAVSAGDLDRLVFLAHALKGVAGNVHAASLQVMARNVERAGRDKNPASLKLAGQLADTLETLLDAIRVRLEGREVGRGDPYPVK